MGVVTKGGDAGYTSLFNGRRVLKSDHRVLTYGLVDLLNSQIGVVLSQPVPVPQDHPSARDLAIILDRILDHLAGKVQPELFNIGALLATEHDSESFSLIPRVSPESITILEDQIKESEIVLPTMRFLSCPVAICLHPKPMFPGRVAAMSSRSLSTTCIVMGSRKFQNFPSWWFILTVSAIIFLFWHVSQQIRKIMIRNRSGFLGKTKKFLFEYFLGVG